MVYHTDGTTTYSLHDTCWSYLLLSLFVVLFLWIFACKLQCENLLCISCNLLHVKVVQSNLHIVGKYENLLSTSCKLDLLNENIVSITLLTKQ